MDLLDKMDKYLVEVEPAGITVYRAKLAKELGLKPKHLEFVDKDNYGYYFNVTDRKHKLYKSTRMIKRI